MRSAFIILTTGACVASLMPQMPAYRVLAGTPAMPPVLLLLVAVVVGIVATRRAWSVAGCAYLVGVATWVVVWLRPSPPWAPSDNWHLAVWAQFLLANVLLPTLIFAAAAATAHVVALRARRDAPHSIV